MYFNVLQCNEYGAFLNVISVYLLKNVKAKKYKEAFLQISAHFRRLPATPPY